MAKTPTSSKNKHRSFLKWAGGKFRLTEEINRQLPKRKKCLVEPFVGAGSVFLNSRFEQYILADINPDLINLFKAVQQDVEAYIEALKPIFFHEQANTASYYYHIRQAFNDSQDPFWRSVYFVYLNRFGFNGLCRYNKQNKFNVPFGKYKTHYFPEQELRFFAEKAKSAVFICADFEETFQLAPEDSVIYCDPPYAPAEIPLPNTNAFTNYAAQGFTLAHQEKLANLAKETSQQRHIPVIISNHDSEYTRRIYQGAKIKTINVQRSIGQQAASRVKVQELIALFKL